MNEVMLAHIAAGSIALVGGAVAVSVRKGRGTHASAGTWFCGAMLVLGVTASLLAPLKQPAESPVGGLMVCYFVATAWMAARRRDGVAGRFEKAACAVAFVLAALILGEGAMLARAPLPPTTPPGPGALIGLGSICLLAAAMDLAWVLRGRLSSRQRLIRHLWRMCFAFFFATGSFFLGQQDVLPAHWRGSPYLLVPAFLPFLLMLYWMVRVQFFGPSGERRAADIPAGVGPPG